jgi:DNA-binding MarR family transcriptional regulator
MQSLSTQPLPTQLSELDADEVAVLVPLARRRLKQAVASRLAPYNLGTQQFWVLLNLRRNEGISLHELAVLSWTDDPTACRMVNKLVKRGLVRSEAHPEDRRRFRLALTAKGRKLANTLESLSNEIRNNLNKGLSPRDRKQLAGLLRRVIENTEKFADAA